jgi:hypothetical protein
MKAVEFCYWLQGLFELGKPEALTAEQTATVKAHLDMVFIHDIDPSYPAEEQEALNTAHVDRPRPQIGGRDPVTGMIFRC